MDSKVYESEFNHTNEQTALNISANVTGFY